MEAQEESPMTSPIPAPRELAWQRPPALRAVPQLESAAFSWLDEETGDRLHVRVQGSTRFVQELGELGFKVKKPELETVRPVERATEKN
jgi:hypothetical protein